jgi:hypothetical protein
LPFCDWKRVLPFCDRTSDKRLNTTSDSIVMISALVYPPARWLVAKRSKKRHVRGGIRFY